VGSDGSRPPLTRNTPAIEPRGDDLAAVTEDTRRAAAVAAAGGYVAQVWTWRGGEAVVLNRKERAYPGDWVVLVRRGLKRGQVQLVHAGSIATALASLGIAHRVKSARRRPYMPEHGSREWMRARLRHAARRRDNRWRTLRAGAPLPLRYAAPALEPAR